MFIVARTSQGRPTLMHQLDPRRVSHTLCGVTTTGWSGSYSARPVSEITCRRCGTVARSNPEVALTPHTSS